MMKLVRPRLKCAHCSYTTWTRTRLDCHTKTHSVDQQFKCDQCSNAYNTARSLASHRTRVHLPSEPVAAGVDDSMKYACSQCSYTSVREGQLEKHMKRHAIKLSFKCNVCTFTYETSAALERHQKRKHDTVAEAKVYDEAMMKNADSLWEKLKKYNSLKCQHCNAVCKSYESLEKHYRRFHPQHPLPPAPPLPSSIIEQEDIKPMTVDETSEFNSEARVIAAIIQSCKEDVACGEIKIVCENITGIIL